MRLLIAEDDELLARAIADALEHEGYEVDSLQNGADGYFFAAQGIYDLLVLDITMPGMSGLEIVRKLRANDVGTPALFVTARDTVSDRVAGLSIGADDYLVKPFALPELIARVHALLRRSAGESGGRKLTQGAFELDLMSHEARYDGKLLNLTVKEFELLEFLVINRGSILTRGQISDRLWGYDSDIGYGILDVHIHNVRKKLLAASCDDAIKTIRGVGYQFNVKEPDKER